MLFATILTQVLSRTTKLLPSLETAKVNAKVIQNQILPVAACFAISLISSNKAYVYLSVSFIQVTFVTFTCIEFEIFIFIFFIFYQLDA